MDTFGRFIAILLAIVLFFGLPFQHEASVQSIAVNKNIFHDISNFIDQVCIKGEFPKAEYEEFLSSINKYCSYSTVDIEIYTPTYVIVNEQDYEYGGETSDQTGNEIKIQSENEFGTQTGRQNENLAKNLNGNEGKEVTYVEGVYTEEIMEFIGENNSYPLKRGDMITLRVTVVKEPILNKLQNLLFLYPLEEESFVYGGIVW